tara:strand:- start:272 stop:604 length:333 start_codon:yes stop_codon:yes gene_type:complete
MAKKESSSLGKKAIDKAKNYTAWELSGFVFVALASHYGWKDRINISAGYSLACSTVENLPPVTLFGLSPGEYIAIKELLDHSLRRKHQSWISTDKNYTDRPKSGGIISIY